MLHGVPHKIEIIENGLTTVLLDGYIDLTTAEFDRNKVTADTVPEFQLDWLTEVADGFSFQYLYEKEKILTDNDIVFVPYVISSIPNYQEAFLVILTLTFVVVELKKAITDLTESITKIAGYISSISGVIQLVFKLLYVILLLLAVVELILDMVALLIQKVKYKPSMSVNRQIEAACQHLGLVYQSPLLQSGEWAKAHIIPESYSNPAEQSDSRIRGFFKGDVNEQTGYFNGTFGQLLRLVKQMFNARILMDNGTLKILPRVKTSTSGTFVLPDHYKRDYRTNADRLVSNYLLSFQHDVSDANTIDNWEGTNVQATLSPITDGNPQFRLMKGFENVQMPIARGYEKTELTIVENTVDDLLDGISPVIGALITIGNGGIKVINAILKAIEDLSKKLRVIGINISFNLPEIKALEDPKLNELLDGRINMLKLEKDYFTVAKFVLLDVNTDDDSKTKLSPFNDSMVNAEYLYSNFHISNSFAPTSESAQRVLKDYEKVELNLSEFETILVEGLAKLPNGDLVDVTSCKWNPSTRQATFQIEQRTLWSTNIKEDLNIPKGR